MAPRIVGRLTARKVSTAKPKAGRPALVIGDGGGLWLQITRGEGENSEHIRRSWTFRYEINGRRREMGLGALYTFSLAEARARAKALRQQLADGIDPLEARETERRTKLADQARTMTFKQCAEAYMKLHGDGWGAEHLQQWQASLATYVYPKIGDVPISAIDQAMVMRIVEPIWTTKATTAGRVRSRIEAVMDYATANGFRSGDNPAHILSALPKKSKIAPVQHFAALAWEEMPAFMSELRGLQSVAARCTEFLALTASRSGEAIGATWDEIDLKAKTWTIPGERMKAGAEHRVPLSDRALEILTSLSRNGPYVFGGAKPLQETALRRQVLARLRPSGDGRRFGSSTTTHGMRASFKTWASESTSFAPEIVEVALAHKRGGKVEQSYERGDLFEKRARLMQAWGKFCCTKAAKAATDVVPMRMGA
jgi:integrase